MAVSRPLASKANRCCWWRMKVHVPSAFLVSVANSRGGAAYPPLLGVKTVVEPFSWVTWTAPLAGSTANDMVYAELHPNPNGESVPAASELYVRVRSSAGPRPGTARSSKVCQNSPVAQLTGQPPLSHWLVWTVLLQPPAFSVVPLNFPAGNART